MTKRTITKKALCMVLSFVLTLACIPMAAFGIFAEDDIPSVSTVCDFDGDGWYTTADVTVLVRYLSGWSVSDDVKANSDLNGDGTVNNRDAMTLIFKIANNNIPTAPVVTSDAVGYIAHGSTSGLGTSSDENDGLSPEATKLTWGIANGGVMTIVNAKGGTIVTPGKAFVSADFTFGARGPIEITAVDPVTGTDYRDYAIYSDPENHTGNGTQRGSFISNGTVTISGTVIFDEIYILVRERSFTMTVASNGRLRITDSVTFEDMSEYYGSFSKAPALNVEEGGYVYLETIGFSKYTGTGTIVLSDALIRSGKATPETFIGFGGTVVNAAGDSVLIPAVDENTGIPEIPTVTSDAYVYIANGATSGLCTSSDENEGLTPETSKASFGPINGNGALSVVAGGGTIVSTGRGYAGLNYIFPITETPVLMTGVYGGVDYRSGEMFAPDSTSNGSQRGTFLLGNGITFSVAGSLILDDIDVYTRNHSGGATLSVLEGGILVIGEGAKILTMGVKIDGALAPTLNVDEGGYAFLSNLGFHRYTGKGTIVLSDEIIASGEATPALFCGFEGNVVNSAGETVVVVDGSYDLPAIPTLSATDIIHWANGSTNGYKASDSNSGLTIDAPVATIAKAISKVPGGGTILSSGKGFISADATFGATTSPVLITAVDGDNDYRDGAMFNAAGTGSGTQKGTLLLGDKQITVTIKGDYIFDDIDIYSRYKTGAITIKVASGGSVVFGEGANVTDMSASDTWKSSKAPILTVEDGAYAYLYSVGFSKITGSGVIALDAALIESGAVTEATFANFDGIVVLLDGSPAFTAAE